MTSDSSNREVYRWTTQVGQHRRGKTHCPVPVWHTYAAKLSELSTWRFYSGVAKALYLSKRARPDKILPVSLLVTCDQSPDTDDMKKLVRVFHYRNYTRKMDICLRPSELFAFIDASNGAHAVGKCHSVWQYHWVQVLVEPMQTSTRSWPSRQRSQR